MIYKLTCYVRYVGPAVLVLFTLALMVYNHKQIVKNEKMANSNK